MNKLILMGRLTKDPEVRYGGANNTAVAKFNLAVDNRYAKEDSQKADFFPITAFGKLGEFTEKYLSKGIKILVESQIHNNNYKNKNGDMVYGYEFVASNIEFCESKKTQDNTDDFMNIPDGTADELPFN